MKSPTPTIFVNSLLSCLFCVEAEANPNDPYFAFQWPLSNTGQSGGLSGADLGALEAFNYSLPGPEVIVAVIDTGIDYTHPDLASNIWINSGEVPGDGLDNDGNGYIDDVHGYNFHCGPEVPPTDYFGHGTRVTGLIAAKNNNNQSISSVAGGFDGQSIVKLMALNIGMGNVYPGCPEGAYAGPTLTRLAEAVRYAVDHGARVVNMSVWFFNGDANTDAAFEYAAQNGVILVSGPGRNIGGSAPTYPATHSTVWAVNNSTRYDTLASTSPTSVGSSYVIDFSAPGDQIISTHAGGGIIEVYPANSTGPEGQPLSGGSFSSAYATSVVATLLAYRPCLSSQQIYDVLKSTAKDIHTSGRDNKAGWGRISVSKALKALQDNSSYACLLGDLNDDCLVNTADLGILLSQYASSGKKSSDLNQDLFVDTADLGLLLGQFGATCVADRASEYLRSFDE